MSRAGVVGMIVRDEAGIELENSIQAAGRIICTW